MNNIDEKDYRQLLAFNLNRLVDQRGLMQKDVAADIGVHASSLNLYFLGKRFPNAESLAVLSNYFNVPVSTFFKTPAEIANDLEHPHAEVPAEDGEIIGSTLDASALESAILKKRREKRTGRFYVIVSSGDFVPYASVGEQLECVIGEDVQHGDAVLAKNGRNVGLYRAELKDGSIIYAPVGKHDQKKYSAGDGFFVLCTVIAGRRPV